MQYGQPQMLPLCLAKELSAFSYRCFASFPLSQNLYPMRSAQMQGMFAETMTDFIHGFIKGANLINSHGVVKKRILDRQIRTHLHKNYARCPIQYVSTDGVVPPFERWEMPPVAGEIVD